VLGTPHLSSLGDAFNPATLTPLLDALTRFKPDVVGVEAMPPDVVAMMLTREKTFGPVIAQFAETVVKTGHQAQEKLGITWEEAWGKARRYTFHAPTTDAKAMPEQERIALILNMLAAYDLYSALLHWSYLPESVRQDTTALPRPLADELDRQLGLKNEIVTIGIQTARRLGLGRIDYIDDFTVGPLLLSIGPDLMTQLQDHPAFKAATSAPVYAESADHLKKAVAAGDLLPHYLYLNSAVYADRDVEAQWNTFYRTKLASGLDRTRVALWEIRNLQMVAHIRRATAFAPGGRMLVFVGAGHRPFLERYLCQLMDVDIVTLAGALGPDQGRD
jgi:hypothetical protein